MISGHEHEGPRGVLEKPKFSDVEFETQNVGGKTIYRSSAPGRKLIVLQGNSSFLPEPGKKYDVEVVEDTQPGKPNKGKYIVRIVGEEGVPMLEVEIDEGSEIPRSATPLPIEVDSRRKMVYVLQTEIPLNTEGGSLVPDRLHFRHFTMDQRTLETLEKIATAVELRQPGLLEGETAASKTSAIEFLAMITNNEVERINLNGQTDTSELIGKFVPNDNELRLRFEELMRNQDALKAASRMIVEAAKAEGRELTKFESQKIAAEEGLKVPEWVWLDGIIPRAMKKGRWVILDEVNLAEPQILERLNSVLETHPSLTLSENGGTKIGHGGEYETDPRFRIFATKNPDEYAGRNPFSAAYQDRWTSYLFVKLPSEKDYKDMMTFMVTGIQPKVVLRGITYQAAAEEPLFPKLNAIKNFSLLIERLAKFQVVLEDAARKREIGKNRKTKYVFTRRGLIEFLAFLDKKKFVDRKEGKRVGIQEDPKMVVQQALRYFFLDKIVDPDDQVKVNSLLRATGMGDGAWTFDLGGK